MNKLLLTSRAFDDIQEIYDYSVHEWGDVTAVKYIQEFEDAFSILKENKKLLKVNRQFLPGSRYTGLKNITLSATS